MPRSRAALSGYMLSLTCSIVAAADRVDLKIPAAVAHVAAGLAVEVAADKGDGRPIGAGRDAASALAVEVGIGAVGFDLKTEADEDPAGAGAGVFAREKRSARWADARSQETKRRQATRGSYARHSDASPLIAPHPMVQTAAPRSQAGSLDGAAILICHLTPPL